MFLIYSVAFADRCNDTPAVDRIKTRRDLPALPFCHVKLTALKFSYFPKNEAPITLGAHHSKRRSALGFLQQKAVAKLLG